VSQLKCQHWARFFTSCTKYSERYKNSST